MRSAWLIADIGGTHCRLALADPSGPPGRFLAEARGGVCDFPSPEEALEGFLAAHSGFRAERAALAVAGPVTGGAARLTNGDWRFEAAPLARRLNLFDVTILNDLEAQAHALAQEPPGAQERLGGPAPGRDAPPAMTIISPGTGLGVALVSMRAPMRVLPCEGGHLGFAPRDDLEWGFSRRWREAFGRVSWEHVVSGPGLVRLFDALGGEPGLTGPDIMRRGLGGGAVEAATLRRFAALLGALAGDMARAHGSSRVVLSGGLARDLAPVLREGGFRAAFEIGGPSPAYMGAIETALSHLTEPGLVGAHAALLAR